MVMLIDRILENGLEEQPVGTYLSHGLIDIDVQEAYHKGAVFDIEDVVEYLFREGPPRMDEERVPVKPPFRSSYFEYVAPGVGRVGLLATLDEASLKDPHMAIFGDVPDKEEIVEVCHLIGFYAENKKDPVRVIGAAVIGVNKGGWLQGMRVLNGDDKIGPNTRGELVLRTFGAPYLATLEFLRCKNVGTRKSKVNQKIQSRRTKRGQRPLAVSKTLTIQVPGENEPRPLRDSLSGKTGSTRAHTCRGHFKTYTEDAPLFGKLVGTYWWDPSLRGNKAKGRVDKDYKVEMS